MSAVLVLTDYPEAGTNDALLISAPQAYRDLVEVYDTTSADVTDYLLTEGILIWRRFDHGWVDNVDAASAFRVSSDAATAWKTTETYFAMSASFHSGETPIFFARVVNSLTNAPLTSADVDSITLTIYSYSANNIRSSSGTPYVPLDDWKDVALTVADVIVDNPVADPRVDFVPNLVFEPDTLTDNPFETTGQYRAVFTITPDSGNRIPVVIDFRVS